jgi:outer membrane protein OmpA-like peptidoglycan-associated protein
LIAVEGGNKIGSGSGDSNVSIPGLKSLDEALAATGPLPAGDKPIGMPGGALFEYNSYDLAPQSVDDLKKLGTLIQRNPDATFSIEGHTDSFGSPGYNLRLSEQRAESVKLWLVEIMNIAPERIQTRGFGNSKWLVSPDKSKEEQAPNRRVEIVVKTKRQ